MVLCGVVELWGVVGWFKVGVVLFDVVWCGVVLFREVEVKLYYFVVWCGIMWSDLVHYEVVWGWVGWCGVVRSGQV